MIETKSGMKAKVTTVYIEKSIQSSTLKMVKQILLSQDYLIFNEHNEDEPSYLYEKGDCEGYVEANCESAALKGLTLSEACIAKCSRAPLAHWTLVRVSQSR